MAASAGSGRWNRAESNDHLRPAADLNRTPIILAIDDDRGTCETVHWALTLVGIDVSTADSAAEGLTLARQHEFDLMLVDQRLPDIPGIELIRIMRAEGLNCPFVLVSGFLTTPIIVEAMKLGALDVIEKPVDIDDLVPLVCNVLGYAGAGDRTAEERTPDRPGHERHLTTRWDGVRPGSAAERWALHVLKACESPRDLKTIEDWAAYIGVSYSSLRESCHVLNIPPHDARDFARALRAVVHSRRHCCTPAVLLDISDRRTLEKLLQRAGLRGDTPETGSPHGFLRDQNFISRDNAGLRVIMLYLMHNDRI